MYENSPFQNITLSIHLLNLSIFFSLGGYYGTGERRGGTISHFLLGVATSLPPPNEFNQDNSSSNAHPSVYALNICYTRMIVRHCGYLRWSGTTAVVARIFGKRSLSLLAHSSLLSGLPLTWSSIQLNGTLCWHVYTFCLLFLKEPVVLGGCSTRAPRSSLPRQMESHLRSDSGS